MLHREAGKPTEFRCVETLARGKMVSWAVELPEGSSATLVPPGFFDLVRKQIRLLVSTHGCYPADGVSSQHIPISVLTQLYVTKVVPFPSDAGGKHASSLVLTG